MKKCRTLRYSILQTIIVCICFFISLQNKLYSDIFPSQQHITLQLKWTHQFQFAGYYMALEKGYYKAAGLNVQMKEGGPYIDVIKTVLAGKADYGIEGPRILIERSKGKPLVVLSAIFQHSPIALAVKADSNIYSPHDLIGKKIAYYSYGDIAIQAMLLGEGVLLEHLNHTYDWNFDLFKQGEIDAHPVYVTNEVYELKNKNIKFRLINPISYGLDFYGDCLFTLQEKTEQHPTGVEGFLKATKKGWYYALNHIDETIKLIRSKYKPSLSEEQLKYEASAMRKLIMSDYVEIGHINTERWQRINNILKRLNMIKHDVNIDNFIYKVQKEHAHSHEVLLLQILGIILIVAFALLLFNRKLNKEVEKRTEEIRQEKCLNNAIILSLPGIFFMLENGVKLKKWNKNLPEEFGIPEKQLKGVYPLKIFPDYEKERIKNFLKEIKDGKEKSFYIETDIITKKGVLPYLLTAVRININNTMYIIGTGFNLSEKKQLQEQLLHAQKMDSIGRLAGGIAHDFNNILTTILGYGEILQIELKDNDSASKKIKTILQAGKKAAVLTDRLLTLSRKQVIKKSPNNINALINDFMKIMKKILRDDIEVVTEFNAEQSTADVDSGQIEQVLLNLALNAKDAMIHGGKIKISTENIDNPDQTEGISTSSTNRRFIKIVFEDNGIGIKKEDLNRIFDPFFTTKDPGKGTGLGLSTVYSIIKQHNGSITADSSLNQGTEFTIFLPVCDKIPDSITTDLNAPLPHGNETILIVDDDINVLELLFDCLNFLGYKCLKASSGENALKIIKENKGAIDMLLTDVIMPKTDGKKLSEIIQNEYPEIIVVYMSGYSKNIIAKHGILPKSVNYISKPITPKRLAIQVRNLFEKEK